VLEEEMKPAALNNQLYNSNFDGGLEIFAAGLGGPSLFFQLIIFL
jgi:hypothetical protein